MGLEDEYRIRVLKAPEQQKEDEHSTNVISLGIDETDRMLDNNGIVILHLRAR